MNNANQFPKVIRKNGKKYLLSKVAHKNKWVKYFLYRVKRGNVLEFVTNGETPKAVLSSFTFQFHAA